MIHKCRSYIEGKDDKWINIKHPHTTFNYADTAAVIRQTFHRFRNYI